jgi:SAM-dependent methyltransferase
MAAGVSEIATGQDGNYHFDPPDDIWDHLRIAMVREWPDFIPTGRPVPGGIYLHLGHGRKWVAGYTHLEWPEWDGERDPLPYPDNSVSGIITYHTLDHIANPLNVLAEAARVLKPGGTFTNIVPHYLSELANSCLAHKSRYAIDTWRNAFSERQYSHNAPDEFQIGFNMIMGLTERNLVLVTQLIRN